MRSLWILAASLPVFAAGCAEPSREPVAAGAAPVPNWATKREPVGCTIQGDRTCESGKVAADQQIVNLFKQVPKVKVQSNEFALTVAAPGK